MQPTSLFLEQAMYGTSPLSELNVLFVGPRGVGKTSLVNCLMKKGEEADPTEAGSDDRATIGVDVGELVFEDDDGNRGAISMWDLGGQEEYYMTHAFFLSDRSLFMIVVDLANYSENEFDYHAGRWLRAVQVHVWNPFLVVAGTQADRIGVDMAEKKLKSVMDRATVLEERFRSEIREGKTFQPLRFTSKASFLVSGVDPMFGDGVPALYKMIRTLASDPAEGVALRVPLRFVKLRKLFLSKRGRKGFIRSRKPEKSLQKYQELRKESGYDGEDALFRVALALFRDIGVILWYEKNPSLCDYVFTDPVWIVDLVRNVFRHDLFYRPETKRDGILYDLKVDQSLKDKLSDKCLLDERLLHEFPVWNSLKKGPFMVVSSLMQEFELMFQVARRDESQPKEFLVPLFLRSGFWGSKQRARVARPSRSSSLPEALKKLSRRSKTR